MYLSLPLKGFLLELDTIARGQKNQNDGANGLRKKFVDIFSFQYCPAYNHLYYMHDRPVNSQWKTPYHPVNSEKHQNALYAVPSCVWVICRTVTNLNLTQNL